MRKIKVSNLSINTRRRTICCGLTFLPWALKYEIVKAGEGATETQQYLSDSDRTACFLESVQRQTVGLGTPPWSISNDMAAIEEARKHLLLPGSPVTKEDIDKIVEQLKNETPPTRFESGESYDILKYEMTDVVASAKELQMDVPGSLLIGSLPTPNINAEVIVVPDSFTCEYKNARQSKFAPKIILVNTRILSFAHEVSKIVVSCIPYHQDGNNISFSYTDAEIEKKIKSTPELVEAYINNILEFSLITHTPQYVVDPIYDRFLSAFRDGIEYFILGHEFSHIALHHTSSRGTPLSALSPPGQKQKILDTAALGFSWKQEMEADFYGIGLAKQTILDTAAKSEDPLALVTRPIGLVAPVLFFDSLKQLENATSIIETGIEPKITKEEYDATLAVLDESFQSKDTGGAKAPTDGSPSKVALPDHPPLWARQFFATRFVQNSFSNYKASDKAEQGMFDIAKATVSASNTLYELSKPKLFEVAATVKRIQQNQ
jgi:hypothetical protein